MDLPPVEDHEGAFRQIPGFYELSRGAGGEFRIKRCSSHFASLFGYDSPEDIIGTSIRDLIVDSRQYYEFSQMVEGYSRPVIFRSL